MKRRQFLTSTTASCALAIVAPVAEKLVCPALPVTTPHVAAPAGAQLTLPASVTPEGNASLMFTCVAAAGPVFLTVTVYVAVPPGV